ncbi:MAG: LysM peptidoglycan-binding domain-containing protein, partial [Porticoccaceae bacterium]|nr:LysM peptidoglycan-binding domain-containing protein [Porticoccaceae bacterium]
MMLRQVTLLLFFSAIIGCTSYPAEVDDRRPPARVSIKTHLVEAGESLYSIAWRYDLNVPKLAQINQLNAPYLISPGQRLKLEADSNMPLKSSSNEPKHKVSKGETLFYIASQYGMDVAIIAKLNNLKPPYIIKVGQLLTLTGKALQERKLVANNDVRNPLKLPVARMAVTKPSKLQPTYSKNWVWKWPIKGAIVESFNPKKLQKGLKIKSSTGVSVYAAAPGNIVYAGSGLRGYGRLIIIKH